MNWISTQDRLPKIDFLTSEPVLFKTETEIFYGHLHLNGIFYKFDAGPRCAAMTPKKWNMHPIIRSDSAYPLCTHWMPLEHLDLYTIEVKRWFSESDNEESVPDTYWELAWVVNKEQLKTWISKPFLDLGGTKERIIHLEEHGHVAASMHEYRVTKIQ